MIEFSDLDISFFEKAQEYLAQSDYQSCEACFADQLAWGRVFGSAYGEADGFYLARYAQNEGKVIFSAPMGGGDVKALVGDLKEYADGRKVSFSAATDKFVRVLEDGGIPFEKEAMRDSFDYIYTAEKLQNLSGKKLHGKRNHLKRFMSDYDYRVEAICRDNIDVVEKINHKWCVKSGVCKKKSADNEFCAFRTAADNFEELGLRGIILYVDDQPIGYTMGAPLYRGAETFDVLFEKIATEHTGAYTAINNLFAKSLGDEFKYINREDDMGLEGLRKAKLSYQPDILLEKYKVTLI